MGSEHVIRDMPNHVHEIGQGSGQVADLETSYIFLDFPDYTAHSQK